MLPAGAVVVDVGSQTIRGNYFKTPTDKLRIVAFDLQLQANIDFVGDAQRIPLKNECADMVMCVGVFLAVPNPQLAIQEILRILKPGGMFYLNSPWTAITIHDPYDLWRFSVDGLRLLCRQFEEIQAGTRRGPASTIAELLRHFFAILFCFNSKTLYGGLTYVFSWFIFPVKYLDRWIGQYNVAKVIYGGAFFFGRKPITLKPV
jgi:SAM-dependent methyltransferase